MIALLMFASMALLLVTGQRVFAAIGFVAAGAALLLYGNGAIELPYNQVFKLFNWYADADAAHVHLHGLHPGGIAGSPKTSTRCCMSGSAGFRAGWPSARSF